MNTCFMNGVIYALEREGQSYFAMSVDDGGRIRRLYGQGETIPAGERPIDLGGRAVVPAFIDSHTHFMSKVGLEALGVRLSSFSGNRISPDCLDGVAQRLRRAGEGRGKSQPLLGYGLVVGSLKERRLPKAAELDSWLPGRMVIVLSMDGHSSSYSSLALASLGFASLSEEGGLRGEAHEFNLSKVYSLVMGSIGMGALLRGLSRAVGEAVDCGISTLHCLEGTEGLTTDTATAILARLGPKLPVELRLWLQYTSLERVAPYAKRLAHKRVGGCLAWEMDGSISSRSAAFDSDYLDDGARGSLYRDADSAYGLVKPFVEAGWQTSAHAIGPRGIESILASYERVLHEAGDPDNRRRLRIDHFEFPREDQIVRAGDRRLVLPVQPGFAWMDHKSVGGYREALPEQVRARLCPLRDLVEAGCVVTLSTDAPVQSLDPFVQIAGAVDHPVAGQGLSVFEALRAYTWAGAYAAFDEDSRGTLVSGKRADFVILDRDPFQTKTEDLSSIRVMETWLAGRRIVAPDPKALAFDLVFTKGRKL